MTHKEIREFAEENYPEGTYIRLSNGMISRVWGEIRMAKYYYALTHNGCGHIYNYKTQEWAEKLTQEEIEKL